MTQETKLLQEEIASMRELLEALPQTIAEIVKEQNIENNHLKNPRARVSIQEFAKHFNLSANGARELAKSQRFRNNKAVFDVGNGSQEILRIDLDKAEELLKANFEGVSW